MQKPKLSNLEHGEQKPNLSSPGGDEGAIKHEMKHEEKSNARSCRQAGFISRRDQLSF